MAELHDLRPGEQENTWGDLLEENLHRINNQLIDTVRKVNTLLEAQGGAAPPPTTGDTAAGDVLVPVQLGAIPAVPYNATPLGLLGEGILRQGITIRAGTAPVGGPITIEVRAENKTTVLATANLPDGFNEYSTPVSWQEPAADVFYVFVTSRGTTTVGADVTAQLHVSPPAVTPIPENGPQPTDDYRTGLVAGWWAGGQVGSEGAAVTSLSDIDQTDPAYNFTAVGAGGMLYRANGFATSVAALESPNPPAGDASGIGRAYYRSGGLVNGLTDITMIAKLTVPTGAGGHDQNIIGQELIARLSFEAEATAYRRAKLLLSNNGTSWAVNSVSLTQLPLDTPLTLALRVGGGFGTIHRIGEDGVLTELVSVAFTGSLGSNANVFGLMALNSDGGFCTNGFLRAARVYSARLTDAQLQTVAASPQFSIKGGTVAQPFVARRLNAGGGALDVSGVAYEQDAFFSQGGAHTTTRPELLALDARFHTYRYGAGGVLVYNVPAAGRARIRIHAAEPTFPGAGQRVFSILANGGAVFKDVDLAASVGPYTATSFEYVTDPSSDGYVRVELLATRDNPIIAAIEVLDAAGAALTPSVPHSGGGTVVVPPATGSGAIFGNMFTDPLPAGTEMLAFPSQDYCDSVGVAVHWVYDHQYFTHGGRTLDQGRADFVETAQWLGVTRFRDGWGWQRDNLVRWVLDTLRPALGGVLELSMTHDPSDFGWDRVNGLDIGKARQVRDEHKRTGLSSVIKFQEGHNELDLRVGTDLTPAKTWSNLLSDAYKEDPAVAHVVNSTMSFANLNNESLYTSWGLSPKLDAGTSHAYPGNNYVMDDAIMDRVDRHFNHIVPGKPIIQTETGTHTAQSGAMAYRGHPEDAHRVFIPMLANDLFRRGRYQGNIKTVRTYFYEWFDKPEAESMEARFGLFRANRTPKPGTEALKRDLDLCRDTGTRPALARYNIKVTGGSDRTKTMLLRKSNGRVLLKIWQQERVFDGTNMLNPPNVNVTVDLGAVPTSVTRFQPTQSSTGTVMTAQQSFTVTSSEDITILEINGLQPTGSPFVTHRFYLDPNSPAKRDADLYRPHHPGVADQFLKIANAPVAIWAGDWIPIGTEASWISERLAPVGELPVFVLYNIPVRDNGGYSGGGAASADAYRTWIGNILTGLGTRRAVLIYEPDALGHLDSLSATHRAERVTLMKETIARLTQAGHYVYTDAGHSNWHPASTWSRLLVEVGAGVGRGIALNVSNFRTTADTETFGSNVIAGTGAPLKMLIDTSRNGLGPEPNNDTFNPPGRALGNLPSAGSGLVDAYFYIKTPGESDGNDGVPVDGPVLPPPAGRWYRNYAYGLAKRAAFGATGGPNPPAPNITVQALTSDFSSLDTVLFPGSFGASIVGGRLSITPTTSYPRASTGTGAGDERYSLINSTLTVEVPVVTPAGNGTISTILQAETAGPAGGTNSLEILKQGSSIVFRELVAGVGTATDEAIPYDSVAHRWWRIRHASGTVHWETSPDGIAWTTRRSKTPDPGLDLNTVTIALVAGYFGTETTVGTAEFDNLNLPPAV